LDSEFLACALEDLAENLATDIFFARLMIAITPFGVERIDTPRPLRHAGCCFTEEYTRRPGLETRSILRITGSPSKYFSSI
jgi:hypothetical protein